MTALTLLTQFVLALTLVCVAPLCLMATYDIVRREDSDD